MLNVQSEYQSIHEKACENSAPIHTHIAGIASLKVHYTASFGPDIEFSFQSATVLYIVHTSICASLMKLGTSFVRHRNNGTAKIILLY